MSKKNRHTIEVAKSRVVIDDGKIISVSEPKTKRCPLHDRFYGKRVRHTKEFIKKHVLMKIKKMGMFTKDRQISIKNYDVPYGASEMLADSMKLGIIDAAVLACDGAGTVIATKPSVVQGIGASMTGLIETCPIHEVIEKLEKADSVVVDKRKAQINQFEGVKKAAKEGYRKIAVTIIGDDAGILPKIRKLEKIHEIQLTILVVHTTGIDENKARLILGHADLVWQCASDAVSKIIAPKAKLQIGVGIPVFALTKRGKQIIGARVIMTDHPMLISSTRLPVIGSDLPFPFS